MIRNLPHPVIASRAQPGVAIQSFLNCRRAFTLVEMLFGMSLALMIMTAVLSSYLFLGRNLVRLVSQQTLETAARRTLGYFAQDVRMASGISGTPSASSLTLTLPTSSNTTTVTYAYDSAAGTLTRSPASGTAQVLASNLLSFSFAYYDDSGNAYTSATLSAGSYLSGIKRVALTFSSQAGNNGNGTQTGVSQFASSRLIIRNRQLLP